MNETAESETAIEKLSGNIGTSIAGTLLAVFSGNPIASVLPILTQTLASERHKARVEETIKSISNILSEHEALLKNISDQQYKLINEIVLSVFQTIDIEKLKYLQCAVENTLHFEELKSQETELISRIIRDMSAEEVNFLINNFSYNRMQLSTLPDTPEGVLRVDPNSKDGLIVSGLISMGLLLPAEPTWDESGLQRFSNIVAKLIVLLNKKST